MSNLAILVDNENPIFDDSPIFALLNNLDDDIKCKFVDFIKKKTVSNSSIQKYLQNISVFYKNDNNKFISVFKKNQCNIMFSNCIPFFLLILFICKIPIIDTCFIDSSLSMLYFTMLFKLPMSSHNFN